MWAVHWPSFWLGMFLPSMTVLIVLVVGGLVLDVVDWCLGRDGGPL